MLLSLACSGLPGAHLRGPQEGDGADVTDVALRPEPAGEDTGMGRGNRLDARGERCDWVGRLSGAEWLSRHRLELVGVLLGLIFVT